MNQRPIATIVLATACGTVMVIASAARLGGPQVPRTAAPQPPGTVVSSAFEFRAVSADPRSNGETDFKGVTAVLGIEERVAFLSAYADVAAAWFGAPKLDQLAVSPGEAEERVSAIKPQPLTSVRRTIGLNDGWLQTSAAPGLPRAPARPWRALAGVRVQDGAMTVPAGSTRILDLSQTSGWRYELRWEAGGADATHPARWRIGNALLPDAGALADAGWHRFRFQADLSEQRGYLSRDGQRVADFPLADAVGRAGSFTVVSDRPVSVRALALVDYRQTGEVRRPFEPVLLAHDDFRLPPSLKDWTQPAYDDTGWLPATLPCVHGGFIEAEEDLFLRRAVDLPRARRVLLEIEAVDPSGDIYVNGALATHVPDRTPILLDVTRWARPGRNVFAIRVTHNRIQDPVFHAPADLATGWFAGRAALHLIGGDLTTRDLLVHTAELDARGDARQTQRFRLENAGDQPFDGTAEVTYRPWFPSDGPVVATRSVPVSVGAKSTGALAIDVDVPQAATWSPANPRLYQVSVTLRDASGRAVDDVVTTTGVRTIAQKQGQLLLNGEPALLIGAQTMGMRPYPDFEDAARANRSAPAAALMSEMLAIKKMGGNLLRVHVHSSNQLTGGINDPRIAEMADQLGLALFWTGPSWIREGDERRIGLATAGEYIRQVYNHPSIVNWELSNHPNSFKTDDGPERTHEFVQQTVRTVLAADGSRLITPTTYWEHAHYGNDLGTIDWKQRPVTAVAEYTHPLVTRGTQDAVTGYGAEWSRLREWPKGLAADTLKNAVRAWFNFEHEESSGQPNWTLSAGWPWHHLRSYETTYEEGSIGRVLSFDEWRASQAWQAFSAYESMRKQIRLGTAGFSWCTIEGGANSGTYEKPLLDPFGHAKLAWYVHKMVSQPVLAGSDNVDTVYGPADTIAPVIFNLGPPRVVDLTVSVKTPDGKTVDVKRVAGLALGGGRSVLHLEPFRPALPRDAKYVVVEYVVTAAGGRRETP
jgi:hypothetical protein